MIQIRIKESVTAEPAKSVNAYFKEYHIEGNSYTISRNEIKTFPDGIGSVMLASDSDLEVVSRS